MSQDQPNSPEGEYTVALSADNWRAIQTIILHHCSDRGVNWVSWSESIADRIQEVLDRGFVPSDPHYERQHTHRAAPIVEQSVTLHCTSKMDEIIREICDKEAAVIERENTVLAAEIQMRGEALAILVDTFQTKNTPRSLRYHPNQGDIVVYVTGPSDHIHVFLTRIACINEVVSQKLQDAQDRYYDDDWGSFVPPDLPDELVDGWLDGDFD